MLKPGVYNKGEIDAASIIEELTSGNLPENVGAIMIFIGVVRAIGKDDKRVLKLEIDSYKEHADMVIQRICNEVKEKYNVSFVKIYHLMGSFNIGEPLVFVIVASRSRKEAMLGLQEAIERYKREPALWKKEVYVNGTYNWISHE